MELFSTKYTGVLFAIKADGTKTYYVSYRKDGKRIKKCIGTDWTLLKASKERSRLINTDTELNVSLKLKDIFSSYMDSIGHKPDTRNTVGRFNNHINSHIGSKRLDKITPYDIQKMKNELAIKVSSKTKKVLSPKYVNDMLNLVHTIYLHYNKFAKIKLESPACPSRIDRFHVDNSRLRFLTKDEVESLYYHIKNRNTFTLNRNVKDRVTKDLIMFVKLSLATGARLSSILSIRVKDLDFDRGVIDIVNHKSGGRHYNGYFGEKLSDDLNEWIKGMKPTEYLVGKGSIPLHRSTISRRLQIVLDRVFNEGVTDRRERVVVHTLRHTVASNLAIKGVSLHHIMKILDHTTVEQTQRYAKLAPDSGKSSVIDLFN